MREKSLPFGAACPPLAVQAAALVPLPGKFFDFHG
jgi:hypothetical protein